MITFQQFIKNLTQFWEEQGCILQQGYDLEVGAGTFNPATFLRCLGPEPYRAAYMEPCRRPSDGRYGANPNRLQHFFQFQVLLKPSPLNIQEIYLRSLKSIGFDLNKHDIRFIHDDWENPTIGAWGLGWEVWMDGMEISQFTYFQSVGGVELKPISGEITYGVERLAMYLQKVDNIFDLQWNNELTYGDIYQRNEVEWSHYNFEHASVDMWQNHFTDYEREAKTLIGLGLPIPAYDFVMKASHAFNLLDARGVISVTERTGYITRIRDLSKQIAEAYCLSRQKLNYPLLQKFSFKEENTSSVFETSLMLDQEGCEDFLLEIGSEELPASFVPIGLKSLETSIRKLLETEGISFKGINLYATPRRLTLSVEKLAKAKLGQTREKKGPPLEQVYRDDGSLTHSGEGFFRSIEMEPPTLDVIRNNLNPSFEIREIKGIPYLYAILVDQTKATASILATHLPSIILGLDFPKKMRWSDLEITYPRPLHWIVALFGKDVIPFNVGPIRSNRITYGHRQLADRSHSLIHAKDYVLDLRGLFVMVDVKEREQSIVNQLNQFEAEYGFKVIKRERLIPQVLHMVEWPYLGSANFDKKFLKVPQEVLISEMVEHQKYFPIIDSTTASLINRFIITANIPITDQIIEGNRRVLSARLSDGVFLYEGDLKFPLESFNEKLKKVTFQKELGTMYQKVERLVEHSKKIQETLKISSLNNVERAALLCKSDLASNMVYEFPDLQGIIGKYYARASQENDEVATAIEEHWMPKGENAPQPTTATGIIISLADKFDNLLACFSLGLKPTSSSDPYALRRQVLGIIKILIQGHYQLSMKECLLACSENFSSAVMKNREEVIAEIMAFIHNRIKTVFQDYSFHKDEIEASLSFESHDIYDIFCRVRALHEFRETARNQFDSLYEVYKRAKGQLNGQEGVLIEEKLLIEPAEKHLQELLNKQESEYKEAIRERNYRKAYELIAAIQPSLSDLFTQVKILSEDLNIRKNRLALLKRVFDLFEQLLDFSKIQERV